jgi:hypothetical protein
MKMSGTIVGILALIAGILILFHWLDLSLVVGIFLIVFGVLELVRR